MEPVLEVKNLTKIFRPDRKKEILALDDISFQLYPGEILGIVGESGSGKSTLAKAVLRLIPVTKGSVSICGQEISHLKNKQIRTIYRQIQMVFQNPVGSFDARRTLGDSIGESLRNRGDNKEKILLEVNKLLKQCGLSEELAQRYPHEVSGGQCQRAAIARALAIQPRILICDEATSALDVTVQQQIIELLQELRENRNLSYLFICHNLGLVQSFCDRVLVMHEGKILEEGTPDEVIRNPKSEHTKHLIEAVSW